MAERKETMLDLFIKKRGSVTAFVSLILVVTLTFTLILVDAGKIVTARSLVSGAGDLALTSGLSNYNSVLQDTYGLFAVSKNMVELETNLEAYFSATLKNAGLENQGLAKQLARSVISGDSVNEIVDIQLESLDVEGVPKSQLSETAPLKAQILDYMKYRAPVVIGYGFLEKLNIMSSLPKQQEAVKKKAEFEKKLSEIEKLCKEAYNLCKAYQDQLDGMDELGKALINPTDLTSTMKKANKKYKEMTKGAIAYDVISDLPQAPNWDEAGRNSKSMDVVIKEFSTHGGSVDVLYQKYNAAVSVFSQTDSDGNQVSYAWARYQAMLEYYNYYKDNIHLLRDVKTIHSEEISRLNDEIDRLKDSVDEDGNYTNQDAIDECEDKIEEYDNWYENDFKGRIIPELNWGKNRDDFLKEVEDAIELDGDVLQMEIADEYQWMVRLHDNAEKAIEKLNELNLKRGELEARGQEWKDSIDALPEGSIQTGMQGDYQNKAEMIKEEHITALIKILEQGKEYASDAKTELEKIVYIDEMIATTGVTNWKEFTVNSVSAKRGEEIPANNAAIENLMVSLHSGGFYVDRDETEGNPVYDSTRKANPQTLYDFISLVSKEGKKDPLYEYLENTVRRGKVNEDAKKEAESARDKVKEYTNDTQPDTSGIGGGTIETVMGTGAGEGYEGGGVDANQESENVADDAVETTGNAVSGFAKLGEILVSGRDKLYLMTYATNMFSCFTTNMNDEGTVLEDSANVERTLAKMPFTKTNNSFYRAEQEYILWGNQDAEANLNYTKGTIFGIRLLLNIIYAYTGDTTLRSETLTMATAIAGWTGFGVPIVQNALLITAALAESINDTKQLLEGKSLPLYKTPKTWVFKFSSLAKGVEELTKDAIKAGSNMLYQEMNKLTAESSEKFKAELDKYRDNAVDTLVETSIGAIQTPVQELLLKCSAHLSETHEAIESYAGEEVDKLFDALEQQFNQEVGDGSIAAELKKMALANLRASLRQDIIDLIVEISQIEKVENGAQDISARVKNLFAARTIELRRLLREEASKYTQKLKDDVDQILSEGNEGLQNKINERLNQFTKDVGSSSTPIGGTGQDFADFDGTTASTFSMNYKEYLMVLLAVRFMASEGDAIGCMGNLIETNAKKPDSQYYAGEGFSLKSSYTMLQLKANTGIKPTFLNLPRFNQNSEYFTKDTYPISYQGILGY